MNKETAPYKPSQEEIKQAESTMTEEQAELTEARERHLAKSPEIRDWSDLEARLDLKSWTTGFMSSYMKGVYKGREVPPIYKSAHGSWETDPAKYEGEGLSPEEAKAIFDNHELAAKAFLAMQAEENKIVHAHGLKRLKEERAKQVALEQEEASRKKAEVSQKVDIVLDQLGIDSILDKVDKIDDRLLVEKFLSTFALMRISRDDNLGQARVIGSGNTRESDDEYRRVKKMLLNALGVNPDEPPTTFVAAFNYKHSNVYETGLPGVVVREAFDRSEIGYKDKSVLFIEDNPDPNKLKWARGGSW